MSLISALRLRRKTVAVLSSLTVAAALVPFGAQAASAAAPAATAARVQAAPAASTNCSGGAVKPTIVLVHGAWADSSSWNGVITVLSKAGYTVMAAPNPLRGLTSDSLVLSTYLSNIKGPVVLVGHSYGGAVISEAAAGNANVKALVYDDAYIPDTGENVSTLSSAASALAKATTDGPTSVFSLFTYPDAPPNIYDTYLLPSVVFSSFAQDLPHSQAALLAATQSPTSLIALGEPLTGTPAWKSIPSWDIVGRQDKIIPEAAQLSMAHRAKAHITEINSSHVSLISHPAAVATVIIAAARATD